ncbi:MAG: universal stress protein [Ornithinimicrobium sp.]
METEGTASVVVGVDGTAGSLGALRYAAEQARIHQCGLLIVHVGLRYDPTLSVLPQISHHIDVAGRAILAQTAKEVERYAPGVEVTTLLRQGSRITELVECAAPERLLVLGRETQHGLERLIFGTTAAVAARTSVPTTIVPSDWEIPSQMGSVVVGMRQAEASEVLFGAAFEIAAHHEVDVVVVYASKVPDAYLDLIESCRRGFEWKAAGHELVDSGVAEWRDRYPQVPVTVRVVEDWPSEALLSAGDSAGLIVLFRQSSHQGLGAHLGSTARVLIGSARCPVHILPTPTTEKSSSSLELERPGDMLPS